jgi:hypothetical protein
VTATLRMADTAWNSQFPTGFDAYAAYVDGGVGDQPNYAYIVREFPHADHLSIAVHAKDNAECIDIEQFAAVPEDFPGWCERQRKRGVARPAAYGSVSLMTARVLPVLRAAKIARSSVRLWTAHYAGIGPHICAPSTCGQLPVTADGTQWTDRDGSLTADQSLLLADFFGPAPTPKPHPTDPTLEEIVALAPTVKQGDTGQPVATWQGILIGHGYDLGQDGPKHNGVDARFGPVTDKATREFQAAKKLTVDGVAGPLTLKAALTS